MKRGFGAFGVFLVLAACKTVQGPEYPSPPPPPPPPGNILGSAQFGLPDGRYLSCAGLSVALLADTTRTRDRMLALYGSAEHALAPIGTVKARSADLPPTESEPPVASARCDAHGAFAFNDLNAGVYYLIAHVRSLGTRARPGEDWVVLRRVAVLPGETRPVRLAP